MKLISLASMGAPPGATDWSAVSCKAKLKVPGNQIELARSPVLRWECSGVESPLPRL